jgi:predicted nucleic acid-binding protein
LIYLDSAAVIKLLHPEPESTALKKWMSEQNGNPLLSSALVEVETHRTLRRIAAAQLPLLPPTLARINRIAIDTSIRGVACQLSEPHLRSLDAIHLATAMQFGPTIDYFVTYDKRLLAAASSVGLPVASPGLSLN